MYIDDNFVGAGMLEVSCNPAIVCWSDFNNFVLSALQLIGTGSRVNGVRLSSGSLYVGNVPDTLNQKPNALVESGFVGCLDKVCMLHFALVF